MSEHARSLRRQGRSATPAGPPNGPRPNARTSGNLPARRRTGGATAALRRSEGYEAWAELVRHTSIETHLAATACGCVVSLPLTPQALVLETSGELRQVDLGQGGAENQRSDGGDPAGRAHGVVRPTD